MATAVHKLVRKRRVFYIPGYDPYPPRRYREIYRTQSGEQAEISGYEISVRQRIGGEEYGWYVDAVIDGAKVTAEFDVLKWSDLVKSSMSQSIAGTYYQLLKTAWIYIGSGTMRRLKRPGDCGVLSDYCTAGAGVGGHSAGLGRRRRGFSSGIRWRWVDCSIADYCCYTAMVSQHR